MFVAGGSMYISGILLNTYIHTYIHTCIKLKYRMCVVRWCRYQHRIEQNPNERSCIRRFLRWNSGQSKYHCDPNLPYCCLNKPVCVCVYECIYVCIYMCMYVCMYMCVCMCIYMCVYVCISVCLYVYVCVLSFTRWAPRWAHYSFNTLDCRART